MNETQTSWLDSESTEVQTTTGEKLPPMKFIEENKVEEIEVDFSKPFHKYTDTTNTNKNVVKALVPVTHAGVKKIWWLNKKNPTYTELIKAGKAGITKFKVMRNGSAAATRYVFVK